MVPNQFVMKYLQPLRILDSSILIIVFTSLLGYNQVQTSYCFIQKSLDLQVTINHQSYQEKSYPIKLIESIINAGLVQKTSGTYASIGMAIYDCDYYSTPRNRCITFT